MSLSLALARTRSRWLSPFPLLPRPLVDSSSSSSSSYSSYASFPLRFRLSVSLSRFPSVSTRGTRIMSVCLSRALRSRASSSSSGGGARWVDRFSRTFFIASRRRRRRCRRASRVFHTLTVRGKTRNDDDDMVI